MTTILLKENEPFEVAIRRFRRAIEKNGLIAELRERHAYEKPTTASANERTIAARRQRLPKKLHSASFTARQTGGGSFERSHTAVLLCGRG